MEVVALNRGHPLPASYLLPNIQNLPGTNVSLKVPNSQQAHASAVNGIDGQLNGGITNGMATVSPNLSQSVPVRSPSASGQRTGLWNGVHVNGHSLSHHLQSLPTLPNILQSQSPPRILTPINTTLFLYILYSIQRIIFPPISKPSTIPSEFQHSYSWMPKFHPPTEGVHPKDTIIHHLTGGTG